MPIAVTCECGARFAAKDEMAGKRAKCPKCQAILTIPAASAPAAAPPKTEHAGDPGIASLLDEVGLVASKTGVRCPSCRTDMQVGAIICIQCGFHTQTGKKLETKVETKVPDRQREAAAGKSKGSRNSGGMSVLPYNLTWPKVGVGVGAYVALCVVVALFSKSAGGLMLVAPGFIVMLGAGITVAVMAFSESVLLGLLYLLCDIYKIVFVATHWDDCKLPVSFFGLGFAMTTLGGLLIGWS